MSVSAFWVFMQTGLVVDANVSEGNSTSIFRAAAVSELRQVDAGFSPRRPQFNTG